jgi:hypothetical protein
MAITHSANPTSIILSNEGIYASKNLQGDVAQKNKNSAIGLQGGVTQDFFWAFFQKAAAKPRQHRKKRRANCCT